MLFKLMLNLLFCCMVLVQAIDYEGYQIYDILTSTIAQKETLLHLSSNPKYDFFLLPRVSYVPTRVMIKPLDKPEFESILVKSGMNYTVVKSNVKESIHSESIPENLQSSTSPLNSFSNFERFETINNYLSGLAKIYAKRAFIKNVGHSFQGLSLNTITITNGDGRSNKKVIFVDAGIHAREWIAPAAALYIIYQLVEKYDANDQLLKDYDWVVLPVVNPDGYEYSHTNSRLWRKTRKLASSICVGTDGNRNFDFHWGEVGASNDSCAENFMGDSAFSEPETRVVRNILNSLSGRAKFYLTIHAYGSYLLYPWDYTTALPNNWKDIDDIAQAGARAIRLATGTKYTFGSSSDVLYPYAGSSSDYALGKANIPINIIMKLPAGGTGFDPSEAQIRPFVEEAWIGIKVMAEAVIKKF